MKGTVKIEDFEMDYAVFGRGKKTLIILPGISLHSVVASASAVEKAFEKYCDEYTVYLFDPAKNLKPGYTLDRFASDTVSAINALGIKSAYLYGTSMGGMVAQIIAVRYPQLVIKMMTACSCSRVNDHSAILFKEWINLAENGDVVRLNRSFFNKVYSADYRSKFSETFKAMENLGTKEELESFAVLCSACLSFDYYDMIDKIKCPFLVVASACDEVLTCQASIETADRAHADLYVYDGYSHAVYDEADDFRDIVFDFYA